MHWLPLSVPSHSICVTLAGMSLLPPNWSLPGIGFDLSGVDKAVAAYPDFVLGLGKIGQHITPLVVRDHAAGEPRRQIPGFRNHPYPGLRTAGAAHHAADIVVVDGDRIRALGLSVKRRRNQCRNADGRRGAQIEMSGSLHVGLLLLNAFSPGPGRTPSIGRHQDAP